MPSPGRLRSAASRTVGAQADHRRTQNAIPEPRRQDAELHHTETVQNEAVDRSIATDRRACQQDWKRRLGRGPSHDG